MPARIQRKRAKGWRMPANTVSVTRPGPFGNPFSIEKAAEVYDCRKTSAHVYAVGWFRQWLACQDDEQFGPLGAWGDTKEQRNNLLRRLPELRGKNLACFCAPEFACHADVLLELANADPELKPHNCQNRKPDHG